MDKLYLADPQTKEYIGSRDLTDRDQNPRYDPGTHDPADKYIYDPRAGSLTEPMAAGSNQKQRLAPDGSWELVDDFRGQVFWDTSTKEQHAISALGEAPDPTWTDQEPAIIQIWDGTGWFDDLTLWLDLIVRPQRDSLLLASDKYMLSDYPISEGVRGDWATYRQALRDLPESLTQITEPISWPALPA